MVGLAIVFGLVGICVGLGIVSKAGGATTLQNLQDDLRIEQRACDKLLKNEDGSKRDLANDDEVKAVEGHNVECDKLEAKIAELEEGMARIDEARAKADARDARLAAPIVGAPPTVTDNTAATSTVHENLKDDPKGGYATMGEFAQDVHDAFNPAIQVARTERMELRAAMSQGFGSDGGLLVPSAHSSTIWTDAQKRADSLLPHVQMWTVPDGADSIEVPALAETSRVDGSRWGGVRGRWRSELQTMTATNPTLRSVKLEPHELYVFIDATNKLIRNAPQVVGQLINECAPDEINFKINDAIVNGTGGDQPRGFLKSGAVIEVAAEDNQFAETVIAANIIKMHGRMMQMFRAGAVWLINQDVEEQLDQMFLATGQGGWPMYMPPGNLTADAPGRLKGKPVIPIEYCQKVGTVGDIVLWNGRTYAFAAKGPTRRDISTHLYFDAARTAFRFMAEVDGAPIMTSPITPKNGTKTYSGEVTLAVRA